MLQRVSFSIGGQELVGVLHLAGADSAGAALVLHGFGGHPDQPHIVETAAALAAAGVAAYRFPYRDHQPPKMSLASALEDAEGALQLLGAHPQVNAKKLAVVGFSFGGAVAALLAGRERRIRAAVLGAGTSRRDGYLDPISVLAKTKARVLLIWGARDTEVATIHADRYATALAKAGVVHEFVSLEGADHDFGPASCRARMAARVTSWVRESFEV
jgi:dienelactone hydrolase